MPCVDATSVLTGVCMVIRRVFLPRRYCSTLPHVLSVSACSSCRLSLSYTHTLIHTACVQLLVSLLIFLLLFARSKLTREVYQQLTILYRRPRAWTAIIYTQTLSPQLEFFFHLFYALCIVPVFQCGVHRYSAPYRSCVCMCVHLRVHVSVSIRHELCECV